MKDEFDKLTESIAWPSDKELKQSRRAKVMAQHNKKRKFWSEEKKAQWLANCSKAQKKNAKTSAFRLTEARKKPFRAGPYGDFDCKQAFDLSASAQKLKINGGDKMIELPHLYYYIEDGPGETIYQWVVYTPYGVGPKNAGRKSILADLFRLAKKAKDPYATSYSPAEWFSKMKRKDPKNYYEKWEPKREWSIK